MKNFIKLLSISLMMSGTFLAKAAEYDIDAAIAASLGKTRAQYVKEREEADAAFAASLAQEPRRAAGERKEEQAHKAQLPQVPQPHSGPPGGLSWNRAEQEAPVHFHVPAGDAAYDVAAAIAASLGKTRAQYVKEQEEADAAFAASFTQEPRRVAGEGKEPQAEAFGADFPIDPEFARTQKTALFNIQNRAFLEGFKGMLTHIKSIPQKSDVHVLDPYVNANIGALLEVGRRYGEDNSSLTLADVGQQMIKFANDHAGYFANYRYEDQTKTKDEVIGIINTCFSKMDQEIGGMASAREVWSRAWTLALKLYEAGDDKAIQTIFDEAIEGHLTAGGCLQGRINRGFVAYAFLLSAAGVQ